MFDHILLLSFGTEAIIHTSLLFLWAGFVRSGLGFGGAALGLPLMLFIFDKPIYWLPIIGAHLLFFSALTLRTRIHNVDWAYFFQANRFIIPSALIGVFGLISLPNNWLVIFIYSITFFYALLWSFDFHIHSEKIWMDKVLLTIGGYVAGTSLTGAPLIVAVYMRNVSKSQLRDTLFVLWFTLVSIKMLTFVAFDIPLHFTTALILLPVATIGHIIGLKTHHLILRNDKVFKRVIGGLLMVICILGFIQLYTKR